MSNTFIGINLGSSEVRVVLCDSVQHVLADASVCLTQSAPQPSWREQSPEEWWHATLEAIAKVRADAPAAFARLRGIGISGQTEGAVLLDKHHRLLRPAILASDGRARAECVELEALVTNSRNITGSMALPSFTAPKLLWLQKYERSVFESIAKVLMPKDFILLRLTGEFVTDMSDASSTLCLDVARRDWSDRMIGAVMLTRNHFPRLTEGSEVAGMLRSQLAKTWSLVQPVSVTAGAGNPAAISVGLGMLNEGSAYVSFGPSGLVGVTTSSARLSPESAVRNLCHCLPELWQQLGVLPAATASLDWWAKLLGAHDHGRFVNCANASNMLEAPIFLPYLRGASTPHNDARATGVFFGLSENTDSRLLTYALLEGVAFGMAECLSAIKETGTLIKRTSAIGIGTRNRFWTELLVTVSGMPFDLHDPEYDSATIGAARLACLAVGDCTVSDICTTPPVIETVGPREYWCEDLVVRHARFRRIYCALKSEFAIQEPLR